MYHRIDTPDTDPWGVCVSPLHFAEQISCLKNNYAVISLNELLEQTSSNNITKTSICISFDDGYADNFINAKPILEKYNCPATFFIATAFIGNRNFFWWDELEIIFLQTKRLPSSLTIQIEGENFDYTIDEAELTGEQFISHAKWKWYEAPSTQRCAIFLSIWKKLRPLPYNKAAKYIIEIKNWSGVDDENNNHSTMNEQQLKSLSNNNLFTIGLHTHTHADLKDKSKSFQQEEIMKCKEILQNNFEVESNCLAFPYGRYDNSTFEIANALNLKACFTTEEIAITAKSNLMRLGRLQVLDWNIKEFKNQLEHWLKD